MKKKSSAACLCLCLISPSLGERSISDSQEEEIDRSTAFLSLALGYRSVGSSREEGIHCSNFSLNSLDCMLHIIFHAFSLPLCVCVCVSLSLSLSLSLSDKDKDKVPSSHKRSRRNGLQRSSITKFTQLRPFWYPTAMLNRSRSCTPTACLDERHDLRRRQKTSASSPIFASVARFFSSPKHTYLYIII